MAQLNLTQAAKAAGIARGTLYKHIEQGKISCEIDDTGKKVIDTSELIRVYGEIRNPEPSEERSIEHEVTPEKTEIMQVLRERIEDLEQQVDDLRKDKEGSREREDKFLDIIKQQQTLLLPPGNAGKKETNTKKMGFFGRLFDGRKKN